MAWRKIDDPQFYFPESDWSTQTVIASHDSTAEQRLLANVR